MAEWPRLWIDNLIDLARYVLPQVVGEHLTIPERSAPTVESRLDRVQMVYDLIRARRIHYALDPPTDEIGRQPVRSPHEVLWTPRNGTCLDLALILTAGLIKAGLHPALILIESNTIAHVLVAVRIDIDHTPTNGSRPGDAVWTEPPTNQQWWTIPQQLNNLADTDDLLVIDPLGLAAPLGRVAPPGTTNVEPTFDTDLITAVNHAATYLTTTRWAWKAGVDIGAVWRHVDTHRPEPRPTLPPLRDPYLAPGTAVTPLKLLRAEHRMVPFRARDEMVVLRDFCQRIFASGRTGIAVVTGVGGSGKTRLALELAETLRLNGWYAGVLPRGRADAAQWLASVMSPLLIVIDYAEGRTQDIIRLLHALQARQGDPAVTILTARSQTGEWRTTIEAALTDSGHLVHWDEISLPPVHPRAADVFASTARALEPLTPIPVDHLRALPKVVGDRWTTLDLVLLGWLAARGVQALPTTATQLYDEVLIHEVEYWVKVRLEGSTIATPDRQVLIQGAVCLTLLSPPADRVVDILKAAPDLEDDGAERREVKRTLLTCLGPTDEDGIAVRPDIVGDHLILRELGAHPRLLPRILSYAADGDIAQAVRVLSRAGQNNHEQARELLVNVASSAPNRWRNLVDVALAQRGTPLAALEILTTNKPPLIPLDELSDAIPISPLSLTALGLYVDLQRLVTAATTSAAAPKHIAALLERVATRADGAGDRFQAVTLSSAAVSLYRQLVAASPASFLPDLARSLNNLSNRLSLTGDRDAALASINESVALWRVLLAHDSLAHKSHFAASLLNLSVRQSDTGNSADALKSSTEAIAIYRNLAAADPAFLPDLAKAIGNLTGLQISTGDRAAALASSADAVAMYRQLVAANPAAFLVDLARTLNNRALAYSDTGDRAAALATSSEAVTIHRALAAANPAAFLPNLALTLNNLYSVQIDIGDRAAALVSSAEAVTLYRKLAETNAAAFLPNLAISLNNLASAQGYTGDLASALATSTDTVRINRELAAVNPAAFLPHLATSLNNLAAHLSKTGNRAGALGSINEAVALFRNLAATSSAAFLPDLCASLHNLSELQSAIGDPVAALQSITEAVDLRRGLAAANPEAFLSDFARSLDQLGGMQGKNGDRAGALASVTEAVGMFRNLAATNPDAFQADLARFLNNLSATQGAIGDWPAALISITEAVAVYRNLFTVNSAAFQPDLAGSLTNLSNAQSYTGARTGAITSISEAVAHYRQLAEIYPAAFLPNLATALRNETLLHEAHDSAAARARITEAVAILRELVATDPAAFLPDLARYLSDLAGVQRRIGELYEACASMTETVGYYRSLVMANNGLFLPDLASALRRLSDTQIGIDDPAAALAPITEAVALYRKLTAVNPATFLPKLAGSLSELCNAQLDTGDRAAALSNCMEALDHYGELAVANPTAHVLDLRRGLNDLCRAEFKIGVREAIAAWQGAITAMVNPYAQAALQAAFSEHLFRHSDPGAEIELLGAIQQADADPEEPNSAAMLLVERTRTAIRAAVETLQIVNQDMPHWATGPIAEETRQFADALVLATDWPAQRALLNSARVLLSDTSLIDEADALARLQPTKNGPRLLKRVLVEINSDGIDELIEKRQKDYDQRQAIKGWIDTPTPSESEQYLREHLLELSTPEVQQILAHTDDENAKVHWIILELIKDEPIEHVYGLITDPVMAEDAALSALEDGKLDQLARILAIADSDAFDQVTSAVVIGVMLVANNQSELGINQLRNTLNQAENSQASTQRRALAIRLENLLQRTSIPGFKELRDLLNLPA